MYMEIEKTRNCMEAQRSNVSHNCEFSQYCFQCCKTLNWIIIRQIKCKAFQTVVWSTSRVKCSPRMQEWAHVLGNKGILLVYC